MLHAFAERWMAYVGSMLWQTSIAMIVVGTIYLACRRRSAAIRYALLCLIWGVTGLLFLWVYAPPVFRFMIDAGRMPPHVGRIVGVAGTGALVLFLIILPAAFILFYGRPSVKATCQARDPKPRWTDPIPMPVLVLIVILATSLVSTVFMAGYNFAYPFFGIVVDGLPGALLTLGLAVLEAIAIRALCRMRPAGWWLTVSFVAAWVLSGVVTFVRIDLADYYARMGFSAQDVVLTAYVIDERGTALLALSVAVMIAFAGYLIFIKRYFNKVERNS